MTFLALFLAFAITGDVRKAATSGDLEGARKLADEFRRQNGATPEWLEAYSWIARGALMTKRYGEAARYAAETRKHALEMLKGRKLDDERHLPIALGAAIEVEAQTAAAQGDRAAALEHLQIELDTYRNTSIRTRIQKNINLLGLEGKPAPPIEGYSFPGRPTLVFLWAHWCGDCKAMAPVLQEMQKRFPGLSIVAPTRLYGYAEGGRDAGPEEERRHISRVRAEFYPVLQGRPAPVSDETFSLFGASTTPTLVFVDARGIVRVYHPGRLTADELAAKISPFLS
jgi:thiol-disulfide isomerase/thioredoxin